MTLALGPVHSDGSVYEQRSFTQQEVALAGCGAAQQSDGEVHDGASPVRPPALVVFAGPLPESLSPEDVLPLATPASLEALGSEPLCDPQAASMTTARKPVERLGRILPTLSGAATRSTNRAGRNGADSSRYVSRFSRRTRQRGADGTSGPVTAAANRPSRKSWTESPVPVVGIEELGAIGGHHEVRLYGRAVGLRSRAPRSPLSS